MLEAILRLEAEAGGARVRDLAAALKIHKSTVTATLRQLARRGLIRYSPYRRVALRPAGRREAKRVSSNHALLARLLAGVLQVDAATAEADACRLEHAAGPVTMERLRLAAAFLARRPALYRLGTGLAVRALGLLSRRRGRFRRLPLAAGWTGPRDLPAPEGRTFQSLWAERRSRR